MTDEIGGEKREGTAFITLAVTLSSDKAEKHFLDRFYAWSDKVTILGADVAHSGFYDRVVVVRYKHECVNEGAAYSDARKAVARAMLVDGRVDFSYETSIVRTNWEPTA